MIPEEALEAAKEAMREITPPPGVSKDDWLAEHGSFALIAGAISAAAQHMLAGAWDEGEAAGQDNSDSNRGHSVEHKYNPYRREP